MAKYFVGADGCPNGWVAVSIDENGAWSVDLFSSAEAMLNRFRSAELLLLDIPIGLRDSGEMERLCDKQARKLLGPKRGSSVFPAPCRPALPAATYEEASAINRARTGRGLSRQSWAISPKIREVDDLLDKSDFGGRVREIHPEVCFTALNGWRPMKSRKKRMAGFNERLRALNSFYAESNNAVDYALSRWPRKMVARDDILDALVAAVTAYVGFYELTTLPAEPEIDSRGRPMEIVYYSPYNIIP